MRLMNGRRLRSMMLLVVYGASKLVIPLNLSDHHHIGFCPDSSCPRPRPYNAVKIKFILKVHPAKNGRTKMPSLGFS